MRKMTRLVRVFFFMCALLSSTSALALQNGKWDATVSCGPREDVSPARPAFSMKLPQLSIKGDNFQAANSYREPKNEVTETWQGKSVGKDFVVSGISKRDNGNTWNYELKGGSSAQSGQATLTGAMFAEGKKIRDCTFSLVLKEAEQVATSVPAPASTRISTGDRQANQAAPAAQQGIRSAAQLGGTPPQKVADKAASPPSPPQAASVGTASFDCTKASSVQEKLICTNPALSTLDLKLAEAYKAAQAPSPDAGKLKSEQIAWIKERKTCGSDATCLERSYTSRISELTSKPAPVAQTATNPAAEASVPVVMPAASEPATAAASEPLVSQSTVEPPAAAQKTVAAEQRPMQFWESLTVKIGVIAVGVIALLALAYWLIRKLIIGARKGAAAIVEKGTKLKQDVAAKTVQAKDMMAEKTAALAADMSAKAKEAAATASVKLQEGVSDAARKSAPHLDNWKSDAADMKNNSKAIWADESKSKIEKINLIWNAFTKRQKILAGIPAIFFLVAIPIVLLPAGDGIASGTPEYALECSSVKNGRRTIFLKIGDSAYHVYTTGSFSMQKYSFKEKTNENYIFSANHELTTFYSYGGYVETKDISGKRIELKRDNLQINYYYPGGRDPFNCRKAQGEDVSKLKDEANELLSNAKNRDKNKKNQEESDKKRKDEDQKNRNVL
jgi:uncharacterized protein